MQHREIRTETATPVRARRDRGRRAWLTGRAAEQRVADLYLARGCEMLEWRWRAASGEVDLILCDAGAYVFCEVKTARSFERAAERLQPAQMRRIHGATAEYLARCPMGELSEVRFDLALVDGRGAIRLIENAFGHF